MTSLICELDARGGRHQEEKDEWAALRPRQPRGRLEKDAEKEEAHEVALLEEESLFGNFIVRVTGGSKPLLNKQTYDEIFEEVADF